MAIDTTLANTGAEFLNEIFENLGCTADVSIHEQGQTIRYQVDGEAERLGDRSELVSALSLLTSRVLSRGGERLDCVLDFGGQFESRARFLTYAANELAEVARASNQRILVSDLSSTERKIMHHALADTEEVATRSDGQRVRRFIIDPVDQSNE